jgi:hypothetical protein
MRGALTFLPMVVNVPYFHTEGSKCRRKLNAHFGAGWAAWSKRAAWSFLHTMDTVATWNYSKTAIMIQLQSLLA